MAFCPQCSKSIEASASTCPHCGYDWPDAIADDQFSGWEYSWFAGLALIVAAVTSAVGCLVTIYLFVGAISGPNWFHAFVLLPILLLNQIGLLVLFTREGRRSLPARL